jgi:hypothetical protein
MSCHLGAKFTLRRRTFASKPQILVPIQGQPCYDQALTGCFEQPIGSVLCSICRNTSYSLFSLVEIDPIFEVIEWNELQQLRKNCLVLVYNRISFARKTGTDRTYQRPVISNRLNRPLTGLPRQKRLHAC